MTDLEALISKRIHDFDLLPLLRVLKKAGYGPDDILFKSNASVCSQPGLVQGIRFLAEPARAVVELNFGLLSAQTPLPAYFTKKMESGYFDSKAFEAFIGFFDHRLIRGWLMNVLPEINTELFQDWEQVKQWYLGMVDLKSPGSLHWLFELVYPELDVRVEKSTPGRELATSFPRLGKTVLGDDAIFGKKTKVPVYGNRVTLFSEDEIAGTGEPWPAEAKLRLKEQIFPVLRHSGADLEVFLVIKSQTRWAKLHKESYLGYDSMKGGDAKSRRIRIFRGRLKN